MSDLNDMIKKAIEMHFDPCDYSERYYTWGSYIDLCDMSVKDAIPYTPGIDGGGEESGKTKNSATFLMQKNSSGDYTLCISLAKAASSNITVAYTLDGTEHTAIISAGSTVMDTGISGADPKKPYAVLANVSMQSDTDTFTVKNNVKNGYFKLTVKNNTTVVVENLKYDTVYTLPSAATREGYDFIWKDADGNVISGDTYTMPEKDTTIEGKYYAKEYVLTYTISTEGGETVSSSMTVNYNEKLLSRLNPLTPAKTGYSLDGWKFEDGTIITSATTMPASDSVVKNTYKLNQYSVIYVSDGIQFASTQYYYGEATQLISETPSKIGYEFTEWLGELPATMPARNITLTASFTAIIYYIRYYVDGVQKYEEEHIYQDNIRIRGNESKEGYTFSGWNPATLPSKMPAENIDVNGSFTINQYTLTYYVDGIQYSAITYDYNETITPIDEPSKVGYTFSGWDSVPATMPANDVNVNGEFTVNSHILTYYVDSEVYKQYTVNYGDAVPVEKKPTKTGYTFVGWDEIPETMPDNDVNIYGIFVINQYTITYLVDGEEYSAQTYDYDAVIVALPEPAAREGYTFSGWTGVPAKMPAEDIVVTGVFNINSYELKYYVDGTLYTAYTYEYNAVIVPEPDPVKTGYTFNGWSTIPATMPANDVNVNGSFTINQYTLTFVIDSEPYTSITADYDTPINVPTPSKEGYTFSGWDKTVPEKMPAKDETFNGSFAINSYVANYVIDGEPYTAITYEYGTTINYPDVPKSGYTLEWDVVYVTMPASSITINGTYVEIVEAKTIYYDSVLTSEENDFSGVTGMASVECDKGETANVPVIIPASEEYAELEALAAEEEIPYEEFEAWMNAHNYSGRIAIPTAMNFDYFNGGGQSIKNGLIEIGKPFMVDGNEYQAYAYHIGTCCIATEQTFNHTIENKTSAEG